MSSRPPDLDLVHPFQTPPGPGEAIEVAPGIRWARLPLPFRLDHVNVYLIDDDGGVAILDTGIDDRACRGAWAKLFAGPLAGQRITRLIVTHCHPDHVGLAQWLVDRTGLTLEMSETEYLTALVIHLDPEALEAEPYRDFYESNGLDEETTQSVMTRGHRYLKMLSGLPKTFRRVIASERLRIGGRDFTVMTGGGHSPEQIMLHLADENVFLSADQVLPRISPNVAVLPRDPEGDPLGIFLRSLREVRKRLPEDSLVLPGHDLPFTGLHKRVDAMLDHHEDRCAILVEACRREPHCAAELIPKIFHRALDAHQTGFAFGETLAHVNYLARRGRLHRVETKDGIRRFAAT
ncbi:MAG: fold metallo-hydrolase [Enterovirga sp.]|jgi:glyoxylase-like metal-dependent hydrolase (beta-lactamase superfamily II)|nr:fold metallo-hydrolase [Enterovirga sp.]